MARRKKDDTPPGGWVAPQSGDWSGAILAGERPKVAVPNGGKGFRWRQQTDKEYAAALAAAQPKAAPPTPRIRVRARPS
jgi:hypothetical protein